MIYYHAAHRKFWGGVIGPTMGDQVFWGGMSNTQLHTASKPPGYLRGKETEKKRKGYVEMQNGADLFFLPNGKAWWLKMLEQIRYFDTPGAKPSLDIIEELIRSDPDADRRKAFDLVTTISTVALFNADLTVPVLPFQRFMERFTSSPVAKQVLQIPRTELTQSWAW